MRNKRFNFLMVLLGMMFLFTSFSIEADQLYTTETAWKDYEDVYRPSPVLFLHGFAAGSPKTWQDVVDNLKTHHFDFYRKESKYGHSFGNKVSPYLESIQFFNEADHPIAGKNNSVDTYKAGDHYVDILLRDVNDPGGADKVYYWLYQLVPSGVNNRLSFLDKKSTPIIGTYTVGSEKPKVNIICHSLGGLSARQFLKQYGAGDVAKLITVGTPHKGSPLASLSHDIDVGTQLTAQAVAAVGLLPRLSKILIPKIKVVSLLKLKFKIGIRKSAFISYVSGVKNTRVNLPDIAGIDIQGDAIRDLIPGCVFLNQLNSSVPGGPEYYCVYGQYRVGKDHVGVDLIGGDMVVPVASQKADGVGIPWREVKRIYTNHVNEGATLAENDCETLLGFLDDTEPVLDLVRVLESVEELNLEEEPEKEGGNWNDEDTEWTQHKLGEESQPFLMDLNKYGRAYIEGKVGEEYLPATTEVDIKVYKEGETTSVWENTSEDDLLKPYAGMQPAPAGFRYEVLFDSENPENPEPGVYEIKVFVENPAGLKSQVKTVKVRIGGIWQWIGSPDLVYCLVSYNGKLYAGSSSGIYYLSDEGDWVKISEIIVSHKSNRHLSPMQVYGGNLYVGGEDTKVYRYNGTTWSEVGDFDRKVRAFAVCGGVLYAEVDIGGGIYRYQGGSSWKILYYMNKYGHLQEMTWMGGIFVHNSQLYCIKGSWLWIRYGANNWEGIARIPRYIEASISWGGSLYLASDAWGRVYRWNGLHDPNDSWETVGNGLAQSTPFLIAYNGKMYSGGYGVVWRYESDNVWTCNPLGYSNLHSIGTNATFAVHNDKLYAANIWGYWPDWYGGVWRYDGD